MKHQLIKNKSLLYTSITLNINLQYHCSKYNKIKLVCAKEILNYCNGLRSTKITESPRKNIFDMKRSLLTGLDFFLPLPLFGTSVHISFTFSKTILQCLKY